MPGSGPEISATIRVKGLDDIRKAFADLQASFARSAENMRRTGERIGEGIEKSFKAANVTVRTTGSVGARSFNLIKSAAGGLISILKSGVSLLVRMGKLALDVAGKVAAAGTAAFIAVQAFGLKTGQAIDEMGRLADAAGIPVERFSRLATATRLLGGDVADLGSGLRSLSEKIIDAAKDSEGAGAKAFAQLGVSVRDANGNLKSTEQVLREVADGLASVPKDSLRASAATEIFGGSARALLPILERGSKGLEQYAREADRLGTVVTEQQAKTSRGLLVQYRKVGEALRGIAYRIADDLLPFLTANSRRLAEWLADNADSISTFVGKVLREISGIAADLGNALIGESGKIQRAWIGKLVPAIETARDVALDLLDVFTGGMPTRAPWLIQIGESLRDAGAAALSLADGIRKAAGFGDSKLPTLQEAATAVADAFASMRAGIEGRGEIKMPWAANVGETMRNVAAAIGIVAGVIVEHREEITGFAADFTYLLTEAMAAVKSLLAGEEIAADNPFAFLQEWKASALVFYEGMKEDAVWLKDQVIKAYEGIKPVIETLWNWFDGLAKALGFNNGGELGILLVVGHLTGLLDIAQTLATALAAIALAVNNVLGAAIKLGQIGFSVFKTVLVPAVTALATAFGLPVAAVAAILAAIAALAVGVWYYWDEIKAACVWLWDLIKAGFGALWDGVVATWEGFAEWIGGVFDAARENLSAFWDWLKAAPGEAWDSLVEKWEGFTDWVSGLFDAAKKNLSDFWDWMVGAPGRAWDSLTDIWGGFGDFFSGLVDRVKGYFKGLWDGVKNGASDAWDSVKGWFGLGEDDPADGSADRSPKLATGGIVRGPGGPMADRIRAWLSNGEGVVNARAVAHYGEGFIHALNQMMVPRTAFATGGIVGEMVPAMARPGAGLSDLHLSVFGQRAAGGLYADADGVRAIRRTFRNTARSSRGPVPRWRGY